MKKAVCILGLLMIVAAAPVHAQVGAKPLIGHFAFGYVQPQGKAGNLVDGGWNFSGGATFLENPNRPFGLRGDFSYSWFYAKDQTIDSASGGNVPTRIDDGFASMSSITLDAVYDLSHRQGKVGGYFGLGLGMYSRYWQLTQEALTSGIWCDPWTGWCYPVTGVGNVIADSDRLTKLGYQAVAAITFATSKGGQVYLEASYNYMDSSPHPTTYAPILLGFRW